MDWTPPGMLKTAPGEAMCAVLSHAQVQALLCVAKVTATWILTTTTDGVRVMVVKQPKMDRILLATGTLRKAEPQKVKSVETSVAPTTSPKSDEAGGSPHDGQTQRSPRGVRASCLKCRKRRRRTWAESKRMVDFEEALSGDEESPTSWGRGGLYTRWNVA